MLPRAALAVLAGAAATVSAIGSPQSLTPFVHRRAAIGVIRSLSSGYQPEISHCGAGNTCAEACGAGYDQCGVSADVAHCFNPGAGQTCCSGGTGISCDAGYYCTTDSSNTNRCCPNGVDLATCAKALKVSGSLQSAVSSQAPSASSTTPASTTSSAYPSMLSTTTLNSTSTLPPVSSLTANTTTQPSLPASGRLNATGTGAASFVPSGSPITSVTTQAPAPTPVSAAAAQGMSALLLVAAAAIVLL